MKKQLLLLVMMMLPMVASADAVEIDGIYYNLITKAKQAEVTRNPPQQYAGNIVIPETVYYNNVTYRVTSIGEAAFNGCFDLSSVNIPNSVTSIGELAFTACLNLTSITIGNGVTSIGNGAFSSCSNLQKVIVPDIAAWCAIIFDDYEANPLFCAKHLYCDENTEIKDLVIPNSVTSIGENAFYNCSALTSITISNSVTSIGENAFYNCSALTSITISNSVTSIGKNAFYDCPALTSITIGNSVTSIGENAFYDCYGLKKVIISDIAAWCAIKFSSVQSNPLTYAHHLYSDENTEIKDLVIPNSVTSIGENAFYNCSALTSITISNSVTSIGKNAFWNCDGLKKVIVSDIAAWCAIIFPNGDSPLTYAHHLYSDDNTEIKDLVIPNSVTSISNGLFYGCSGLTSVTIPNSVTSIGDYAFARCTGLTSVNIPNSVTSISNGLFYNCSSLASVTIGNGIQNIDALAFGSCPNITDVYCYTENVPTTQNDAFNDSYIEHVTLHVPATSVNSYKGAIPWSGFKSIVALTDSDPKPTGIDEVRSNTPDVRCAFFNLNGRKLNGEPIQKGVYIQNGKKIIVK